jgi:hypothetical protein
LQRAADASPLNTVRQRLVGDDGRAQQGSARGRKGLRQGDRAQPGFQPAAQSMISPTCRRVLVERGDVAASRKITADMKREWRGDKQAELASLITESLVPRCRGFARKGGAQLVGQALQLQAHWPAPRRAKKASTLSHRLAVDLAHACYATGKSAEAEKIMRQVAAENHEDPHLISQITSVLKKPASRMPARRCSIKSARKSLPLITKACWQRATVILKVRCNC